jgi:hypothetical protein
MHTKSIKNLLKLSCLPSRVRRLKASTRSYNDGSREQACLYFEGNQTETNIPTRSGRRSLLPCQSGILRKVAPSASKILRKVAPSLPAHHSLDRSFLFNRSFLLLPSQIDIPYHLLLPHPTETTNLGACEVYNSCTSRTRSSIRTLSTRSHSYSQLVTKLSDIAAKTTRVLVIS